MELAPRAGLDVDVRLGDSGFGIEWVSDKDRLAYGDRLPAPDPDGQLRLLRADDGHGQPVLILVLDHETYRFASDARAARELGDERDVKQRLRRDLQDFIDYTEESDRALSRIAAAGLYKPVPSGEDARCMPTRASSRSPRPRASCPWPGSRRSRARCPPAAADLGRRALHLRQPGRARISLRSLALDLRRTALSGVSPAASAQLLARRAAHRRERRR